LNSHIRVDNVRPDGTVSHWIDPNGRIHAFDPLTYDDIVVAPDLAEQAGLLPASMRPDVDAYGVDAVDLGRLYRTSWTEHRTFAQALHGETTGRAERLASGARRMPDLFRRALDAGSHWNAEVTRLDERHEAVTRDIGSVRDEIENLNGRVISL